MTQSLSSNYTKSWLAWWVWLGILEGGCSCQAKISGSILPDANFKLFSCQRGYLILVIYISISHYLNEGNLYNDTSNFNFLKVAEITRVLRSGGVFVGTTFLRYTSSTSWVARLFREVNSL